MWSKSKFALVKETRSVTLNIFEITFFLFRSFVKIELKFCFHNKYVHYS